MKIFKPVLAAILAAVVIVAAVVWFVVEADSANDDVNCAVSGEEC